MHLIPIHYKPSRPVTSWEEIQEEATELMRLVDSDDFGHDVRKAFAIHHAQVSENPYAFFAVNSDLIERLDLARRLIINARIVSVNEESLGYSKEGCMSFPYRKEKNVPRYKAITVEYQIPLAGRLETVTEECRDLKAKIFQHEIDHQSGKNIYFSSPK